MFDSLPAQRQRVTEMPCRREKSGMRYRLRLDSDSRLVPMGIKDRHEIKHQDTFYNQHHNESYHCATGMRYRSALRMLSLIRSTFPLVSPVVVVLLTLVR